MKRFITTALLIGSVLSSTLAFAGEKTSGPRVPTRQRIEARLGMAHATGTLALSAHAFMANLSPAYHPHGGAVAAGVAAAGALGYASMQRFQRKLEKQSAAAHRGTPTRAPARRR